MSEGSAGDDHPPAPGSLPEPDALPAGTRRDDRPDEALWSAVHDQQDRDAFAALLTRHGSVVHAFARRLTRSEELGHDITQEVFLRLWETPERFAPARGSVRAFLLKDCYGRSIDRLRAENSLRARGRGWVLDHDQWTASAEDVALGVIHERRLRHLLEALPEQQRDAMLLAFMDGHSYRSVAATLKVPEGTVKSRIRAGLQALHRELVTEAPSAWGCSSADQDTADSPSVDLR